jgi:hypothetical protein
MILDARTKEGTDVSATLINPDQPNIRRKLAGRMHVDACANRVLLQLRASPGTNRAPAESELKSVNLWTRLLLEVKDNELRGIAEVGPAEGAIILNVAFGPPEEVKPLEPKKEK